MTLTLALKWDLTYSSGGNVGTNEEIDAVILKVFEVLLSFVRFPVAMETDARVGIGGVICPAP